MELIERNIAEQELEATWQQAATGGCCLLVCGEAGIGKTALVEQFARHQSEETRLLWGACYALFTPRPLGSLHDINDWRGSRL
jgi:predicted ATPase